jgi:hypothetical protein
MTGFPATVLPGPAQQLTGSPLQRSATIVNRDSVNSIWIGSDRTVKPNLGVNIGPLGSAQWSGQQLWACVDSNVSSSVDITVTDDVTNLDNPVAIGAAIAAKLLATGVPNVLRQDVLVSFPGAITLGVGMFVDANNIGQYGSLNLQLNGNLASVRLDFDFNTPFVGIDYLTPEYFSNIDTTSNKPASWIIPVNAQSVRITNTGVNPCNVMMYGSNRAVNQIMILGHNAMPRRLHVIAPTVANTFLPFVSNDTEGDAITRFNREIFVRCTTGNAGGFIGYNYVGADGVIRQNYISKQAANADIFSVVSHPLLPIVWGIFPSTSTVSSEYALEITEFN